MTFFLFTQNHARNNNAFTLHDQHYKKAVKLLSATKTVISIYELTIHEFTNL